MPMIKQAVRYKNCLPGIHDPLKELKEMERVCLEGASSFFADLFQMFLGTKVSKKQSQDGCPWLWVFKTGQGPVLKDLEHIPYS